MREAERREGAAVEYAQALEYQRKEDQSRFKKIRRTKRSYKSKNKITQTYWLENARFTI